MKILTRRGMIRIAIGLSVLAVLLVAAWAWMLRMPGTSFRGTLPPASEDHQALAASLRADVERLAADIGHRSTFYPAKLAESAQWIRLELQAAGYEVREHSFVSRGTNVPNLDVTLPGTSRPEEIVVVGAHFDSYQGTPGADDNASGVAATLALARRFAGQPSARTIRFAFFVNEEPPAFWTKDMGSWVYAKKCRAQNERIVAMLSLESIGYYKAEEGTQKYPPPLGLLYPDTGDFIAFVGNTSSRALTHRVITEFRSNAQFPSEGAALPWWVPGVGWSDHWSFWKEGYPAVMVTATAPFRNPNYHERTDTPDTLDYDRLSRVTLGVGEVVRALAHE